MEGDTGTTCNMVEIIIIIIIIIIIGKITLLNYSVSQKILPVLSIKLDHPVSLLRIPQQ
jgi:hypothetical protein